MAARKKAAKKAAKKTVKKTARKTRTAAQKAATAKLVALNKAKRAGKAPAKKAARKAPAKKATRRAASRPVFGPTATDAQLDMLERRYAGKVKRRSTLAAKRAEKEKSLTLADFKRGVVASAAPPKAGARRSGRKAQKVYTVAYVCAGPRRSGCGGGKKGSHVIATIR